LFLLKKIPYSNRPLLKYIVKNPNLYTENEKHQPFRFWLYFLKTKWDIIMGDNGEQRNFERNMELWERKVIVGEQEECEGRCKIMGKNENSREIENCGIETIWGRWSCEREKRIVGENKCLESWGNMGETGNCGEKELWEIQEMVEITRNGRR
jgi:hypothetical protein